MTVDINAAGEAGAEPGSTGHDDGVPSLSGARRRLRARVLMPDAVGFAAGRRPVTLNLRARIVLAFIEAGIIVAASIFAQAFYHEVVLDGRAWTMSFAAVGLLAAVFHVGAMTIRESGQALRSANGPDALRDMCIIWLASVGAVSFFIFALKSGSDVSRGATMLFLVFGLLGLALARVVLPNHMAVHPWLRRAGMRHVIAVGAPGDRSLEALVTELRLSGLAEPHVVLMPSARFAGPSRIDFPAVIKRILEMARTSGDGDICIAAGGFSDAELAELVSALQVVPRAVRILPAPAMERFLHLPVRSTGRLLSIEAQRAPLNRLQLAVKRVMDVMLASMALVVLSPVMLLAAIAIRLESGGEILFRQSRLGHRGVPFSILKFRTMTVAEDGSEVRQATARDARVTRVGGLLRRLSIDELPQLFNIIRGEMSLVGPRPHAVAHDAYYAGLIENYEIRQHVKPGLTGWAQVNGLRGETSDPAQMCRRVEYDIWYAKHASIMLDIGIMLLTVIEVFRQRNAH